jgi:hypothetical protein
MRWARHWVGQRNGLDTAAKGKMSTTTGYRTTTIHLKVSRNPELLWFNPSHLKNSLHRRLPLTSEQMRDQIRFLLRLFVFFRSEGTLAFSSF